MSCLPTQEEAASVGRRPPSGARHGPARANTGRLRPLPPEARRDLLADRSIPRIVIGFLSSPSGLGQAARLAATALRNDGYRVLGHDLGRYFHAVAGNIAHGIPDATGHRGPGHVLLVIGAPYAAFALACLGPEFVSGKLVTGYWTWEQPRVPRSWERGLPAVHDVAVPSLFTAGAVGSLRIGQPIRVCPLPVALDHPAPSAIAARSAHPEQPFTVVSVLSVGSGFERKNPLALIRAFKLAFGDRADRRLRMLVTGADHYALGRAAVLRAVGRARNIEITWRPLTRPELLAWWGSPDAYAQLHRAEGFGLALAEAMCAGLPVVATGWSGNMDFMSELNAFPVRYRLCDVDDPQRRYSPGEGQWAEPDIEHAAEILQTLASDAGLAHEIGATARRAMRVRLTGPSFCRNLLG